jgi:hypothetical protein
LDDIERSPLTPQQKAALQVAKVFIEGPGVVSDDEFEELVRLLPEQEVIDLVLYLAVVEVNKTTVMLGLDAGPVHAVFRSDDSYYERRRPLSLPDPSSPEQRSDGEDGEQHIRE